ELPTRRPLRRDLPRHPLDQTAVLLEARSALLELIDGPVVLVAHLRHGIGLPEQVRHLVDLRHERRPELVKDHGVSFYSRTTRLVPNGFPFTGGRRLGEDLALVNTVERLAKLGAGAGADDVAASLLQKSELLGTGIERDEVDLHRPFAFLPDFTRHLVRTPPARVFSVRPDEEVFPQDAGALERGARGAPRLADRGA